MKQYAVRFVHKIAPRDSDTSDPITLVPEDLQDRRTLGKALRERKLLLSGQQLLEMRVERDGRVVAFPRASIWHSIIMTPMG